MLTLYFATGSCALASHIALEEAGATYKAERMVLKNNEQRRPEYLKINPKGRVPALVTDHGTLTETPAILAFIAQSFPAAKLIPADPWSFAQVQSFNSYLCSTVHVAHAHGGRGTRWADDPVALEAMKKKVTQNMADCFALIEREMVRGPWVLGETYSIADPYLYTISGWLKADSVEVAQFAKVSAHRAKMEARPAVQRVLAVEQA